MKVLFLAAAAVLCCILWQRWELTRFWVTEYQISSSKIREQALGLVIADLHGFTYGKENKRLLEEMRRLNPDIIFIPGDMLVSKYSETYETALKTLKEFVKIAPVYYSYGNHESRLRDPERINHPLFQKYMSQVKEAGITVMETGSREIFKQSTAVRPGTGTGLL